MNKKRATKAIIFIAIAMLLSVISVVYFNPATDKGITVNKYQNSYAKAEKMEKIDKEHKYTADELKAIRIIADNLVSRPYIPVCMYHRHGGIKSF